MRVLAILLVAVAVGTVALTGDGGIDR